MQLDVTLEFADKSDDIEVISDGMFSNPTFAGKLLLNAERSQTKAIILALQTLCSEFTFTHLCSNAERCD